MRIGQIAELAGTTTRAVRHYHRIGLLDEPERLPNGYRRYEMADAIRLMRIRWLVDRGLPLDTIATVLEDAEHDPSVTADLRSLIDSLDEQIAVLDRRRTRLSQLLADAEQDRPLSPLPSRLADLFDRTIAAVTVPATRAALLRERELVETLVLSGRAPEGFVEGFTTLLADGTRRAHYLDLLTRWAELEHRDPARAGEEIAAVTAEIHNLMTPLLPEGTGEMPPDTDATADEALPLLDDVVPDPAQQEVIARIQRRLHASGWPPRGAS